MNNNSYLTLGSIRFQGLKGFESFDPALSVNYAEHALISGKQRLQRMGVNLQKIAASILFNRSFCTPEAEIRSLEDAMLNGDVLPLTYGNGTYVGDFIILSLNKSIKQTFPNGSFLDVVVDIELSEYYNPDKLKSIKEQAKKDGFAANTANAVPIVRIPTNPSYEEKDISDMVDSLSVSATAIDDSVDSAQLNPVQENYYAGIVKDNLEKIDGYINKVMDIIESSPDLEGVAGEFPLTLDLLSRSVQDYLGIVPNITTPEALGIADTFQGIIQKARTASLGIISFVITRKING